MQRLFQLRQVAAGSDLDDVAHVNGLLRVTRESSRGEAGCSRGS